MQRYIRFSQNVTGFLVLCQTREHVGQQGVEALEGIEGQILVGGVASADGGADRDCVQTGQCIREQTALQTGMDCLDLEVCVEQLAIACDEGVTDGGLFCKAPARICACDVAVTALQTGMDCLDLEVCVEQLAIACDEGVTDGGLFCKAPARICACDVAVKAEGLGQQIQAVGGVVLQRRNRRAGCKDQKPKVSASRYRQSVV